MATDVLVFCEHCGKSTHPAWLERQEHDIDTNGVRIYHMAKILVSGIPDVAEDRWHFGATMSDSLVQSIGVEHLAQMVARQLKKIAKGEHYGHKESTEDADEAEGHAHEEGREVPVRRV